MPSKKKPDENETKEADIRKLAEKRLLGSDLFPGDLAKKTTHEIIHELRVHQIELEIQNEELKLAHIELELSRDRYAELYDFAPAGYFTLTDKAIVAQVNLFGADLLGVPRQKLQRARFRRFVSPVHLDLWDRFFVNLLSQDKKLVGKFLLIPSDGHEVFARVEGRRMKAGNSFQVRIIVQDITDQKEAEEKNRILVEIADEAPASITVHDFDGNILYANKETFRLHGYTREEFLAKNLHEIDIPDSERNISERMRKVREAGEAEFEVCHFRKDGTSFPLQVHVKTLVWEGRLVLLSIATDLTEKKQIEQVLVESEERYRGLIRDLPDYIFVLRKGKIVFINPAAAAALHYCAIEMIGSSFLSYVAPESQKLAANMMQKRDAGEKPALYELVVLPKDGIRLFVTVQETFIQYEGEPASLVVLSDITDRILAERSLLEANEKLRLLTSITRHDINNQICAINLFQEMALNSEISEKTNEYILKAHEAGDQIATTIEFTRNYEDFGRVSSGWHGIYQLIENIRPELSLGKITLENQIPSDVEIFVDPIIRKVYSTLIDNTIRHGGGCNENSDFLQVCK